MKLFSNNRLLKKTVKTIHAQQHPAATRKSDKTAEIAEESKEPPFRILLLTNRDSDNVGDQVIEICDLSLLSAVMENLGVTNYVIDSCAASIAAVKDNAASASIPEAASLQIAQSDLIVYGGAPMFNYLYQPFYQRTAMVLEAAEEFQKPVIFSAVGIEGYDEGNPRCQRIKSALQLNCVKQITTRDDFVSLKKYREDETIPLAKVADPAVFSSSVFRNFIKPPKKREKKKIGLFILREKAFLDNHIDLSGEDAALFWKGLIRELIHRGYRCELLTSGHFSDESFMDYLIRAYGVRTKRCFFHMDSPERLVSKIAKYDAIVSCRLHPSIIAYSLGIPSLGIVWNPKVTGFYQSIGYADRAIEAKDLTPSHTADKVEQILEEGVICDRDYQNSVYSTLFYGIKSILRPDDDTLAPCSCEELMDRLPPFPGTTPAELQEKTQRKLRRIYHSYNDLIHNR